MAAAGVVFAATRRASCAPRRRDARRPQPVGQRGRAVPADRAGVAHRGDAGRRAGRASSPGTTSRARSRPRPAPWSPAWSVGALQRRGLVGRRCLPRVLVGYAAPRARPRPDRPVGLDGVEVPPADTSIARRFGLHRSRGIVGRLAGALRPRRVRRRAIVQSLLAFWFHERFGLPEPATRRDLLRREPAGRRVGARRGPDRGPDRAHQHDGLHAPAVERAADARPAHADRRARDRSCCWRASASARWTCRPARATRWPSSIPTSARAAAGVTGIARTPGAALSPLIAAPLFAVAGSRRRAVLPRRRPEDRLRPRAVARVPGPPRTGRTRRLTRRAARSGARRRPPRHVLRGGRRASRAPAAARLPRTRPGPRSGRRGPSGGPRPRT